MTGGPPISAALIAGQNRADARLVEHADLGVAQIGALDHAVVEMEHAAVVVEGAAAFELPGAGDRGDAARRVHVDRAVARAREAVAEPEEGALVVADQPREGLDGLGRAAGDARRPGRIARFDVRGELVRRVGVALQIIPVGFAVAEQAMHHRAGQRAVGAGPDQHRQVGLFHGRVHVDVDGDDLGAAFLAGARRVRHHIDLGVHRIGAPDHHAIGLRHFARIGAGELAGAGDEAGEGRIDADGGEEAGIFLGVAQAMDAVALHIAHGAGIIIRPHRFRAVARLGAGEGFGDEIERVVPGDRRELPGALGAGAAQRLQQAIGMMRPLGVARDLGADHAGGIGVVGGAADAADGVRIEHLDLERAGRRAIVRTGRSGDFLRADGLVHSAILQCGRPRSHKRSLASALCRNPALPWRSAQENKEATNFGGLDLVSYGASPSFDMHAT